MTYLQDRLSEKSTWQGLTCLLGAVHYWFIEDLTFEMIGTITTSLFGIFQIIFPDQKKTNE